MLKKLVTGILSLALCASTLAALPQAAYADEAAPTPIVTVEPGEPTPPVEPGEPTPPTEPGEPVSCASEFPGGANHTIVE